MEKKVQITAHLLASSRYIAIANLVVFYLSAKIGGGLFSLQVILFALLCYWHVRVYFDQKLLSDLAAERLSGEDIDETLSLLNLQKNPRNRPLVARLQGSVKLWQYLVYTTFVQLVLFFIQS